MKTLQILFTAVVLTATALMAAPPTTKPEKPKPELPKTGVNLSRPGGGWINGEAIGTRLVIKFFDKDKKPVAPDLERGFVRLKYAAKNSVHAVLNLEGRALVTPATVRPPHNFLVILSLFAAGAEEPAESYNFKYP